MVIGNKKRDTMIELNGIKFKPLEGVNYKNDYERIVRDAKTGKFSKTGNIEESEKNAYGTLILSDLWFVVYFVYKIPVANHKFWVNACREIEEGPTTNTLDLWGREHGKTSIITRGETLQKALRDPERRIGIFSHTRPAAKDILRGIKILLETSDFLKWIFKNILWDKPETQSPKWSEDEGLILKRNGYYRESTFEAWGLLEAMPQGKHFTDRYYDDIETDDVAENPDTIIKLRRKFELSKNLGTDGGSERIQGTYFTHDGVLTYLETTKDVDGKNKYYVRKKPSTADGTRTGKPVFLSQERLNDLMANDYLFNCQHLLNPTPKTSRKLNFDLIKFIEPKEIPASVYRFIVIDSAGDDNTNKKKGDAWAIHTMAVEPKRDQLGASNIYILDSCIDELSESMAIEQIARMYLTGGMIMRLAYEKLMGITPGWIVHLKNLLLAKGRYLSDESGTLTELHHRGRHKEHRIHSALEWPLNNGKIHISTAVNKKYVDRLRHEIEKFPFWHDDGLDALSYFYDLIKDYNFPDEYDIEPVEQMEVGVV